MQKTTYINECIQNSRLVRWPDALMPVMVYIAPFRWYKAKNNYSEELKYRQMVLDAFDMWSRATNGAFSYVYVSTMNDSQISIDWRRVDRRSLGHCNYEFNNDGLLFSADVQIGLSDGIIHRQYQDEDEVRHTIIHEVGHAIGLMHSPFSGDIMYVPHEYGVVQASQRDKKTMNWLYRFPSGAKVSEILSAYNAPSSVKSLDELIYLIDQKAIKSKFEEVKGGLQQNQKTRDLLDESSKIAELNIYKMSLQNVGLPENLKKIIKENHRKSNE